MVQFEFVLDLFPETPALAMSCLVDSCESGIQLLPSPVNFPFEERTFETHGLASCRRFVGTTLRDGGGRFIASRMFV